MSYAEIKPQYYQMHMPDSPWHAGSEGWKSAPWPSFGVNPNLVGPPRLAVEGLGSLRAVGAYYKPEYEAPISGFGDTSNTSSGALLIGLGLAVIVGGVLFLGAKSPGGPLHKMKANASHKKRHRGRARRRAPARRKVKRRARKATGGQSGAAAKTYAYWARITNRDLKAGHLTPGEIDESLRVQFDKDEGEYRRDGITSASQFVKGVRAKL